MIMPLGFVLLVAHNSYRTRRSHITEDSTLRDQELQVAFC
jgi:hypothetical protein